MTAFQSYGRARKRADGLNVSALAIPILPAGASNRAFWVRVTFLLQNLATGATMTQTREASVLGGAAPTVVEAQLTASLGSALGTFVIAANGTDIEAQWSIALGAFDATLLVDVKVMYWGDATAPDGILSAALAAWYRADNPLIVRAGAPSKVSSWPDQSGAGDANRDAVQAAGARQPTFVASDPEFAGQPSLDATAGGNIQLRSAGDWSISVAQPYTVFLVGKIAPASSVLFDGQNSDNNLIYDNGNGNWGQFNGATLNSGISRTPAAVCVFICNGVTSSQYISRASPVTGDIGALNLGNRITLFGDNSGAFSGGKLAELAIWPAALTDAEAQALLAYGSGRYGISLV